MRRRLPPVITPGGMFTLTAFKYTPYSIYSSCAFVSFLGLYTGEFVIAVGRQKVF